MNLEIDDYLRVIVIIAKYLKFHKILSFLGESYLLTNYNRIIYRHFIPSQFKLAVYKMR